MVQIIEQSEHSMATNSPASSPRAAVALPSFQLYGEPDRPMEAERLHVETISSRSRLHDWEIRPHRHEAMFQILHIASGRAEAQVDGQAWPLLGPAAVTVPAMTAHGFRFQPEVQGHVITVQEPHLAALLAAEPGLWARWQQPGVGLLRAAGTPARQLAAAVQALAHEYEAHQPWRATALDVGLVQLVLSLARALPASAPASPAAGATDRAAGHLSRYRALVDARFRLQPKVADLAAELGITATQLNRVCRAVLGRSALDLLHARMLLEAQRQLTYTTLSVKRIGLDLGFTDPGYFTRFFQRACGLTPSAWRHRDRG
jgi:AraC family transcriptional activator of pobA